jgi:hypothetical protein
MRITAAGWARNHGATEIADVDLADIEAAEGYITFGPSNPKLRINRSGMTKRVSGVTVYSFSNLRFTGDYRLEVTIQKEEIARLFRLTHKGQLESLIQAMAFLEEPADDQQE